MEINILDLVYKLVELELDHRSHLGCVVVFVVNSGTESTSISSSVVSVLFKSICNFCGEKGVECLNFCLVLGLGSGLIFFLVQI